MTHVCAPTVIRGVVFLLPAFLAACSSVDVPVTSNPEYRQAARKTPLLEVPPDLTALSLDGRYVPQSGSVSALALQRAGATAPSAAASSPSSQSVAIQQMADLVIERRGEERWLFSPRAPEALWPQVRQFWLDAGFQLQREDAALGVIETDWLENRAKLPQDAVRGLVGRVFDSVYSTGERDQYRIRLERGEKGSEIRVAHRGMIEVFQTRERDSSTFWTHRPSEPALEAEMLRRLMIALGGSPEAARAATAAASAPVTTTARQTAASDKLRVLSGLASASLQMDEVMDRAWRRVGLALDRGGFTVEERNRVQGIYFVRYVDPTESSREGPGFFARLFGAKDPLDGALGRYRITLKASGESTIVGVLNGLGEPDQSPNAQRIIKTLMDELQR